MSNESIEHDPFFPNDPPKHEDLIRIDPITHRPRPPKPTPAQIAFLKIAAYITAASAIYVFSAALVLTGVQQMLPDFASKDVDLWSKLSPVTAIHAYELALISVLCLVAIWKKVFDDSVALSILAVLFMVGTATTLYIIPPQAFELSLSLGLAGLILAGLKAWLFWPRVVGRLGPLILTGLAFVLTSSFVMPGVLEREIWHGQLDPLLTSRWLVGWAFWCLGALLVVIASMQIPKDVHATEVQTPLLQTAALRWILIAMILAGTAAQQLSLAWVTIISIGPGDLLIAGAFLVPLWFDVRRSYSKPWHLGDNALALIYLALLYFVLLGRHFSHGPELSLSLLCYPPLIALITAILMAAVSFRAARTSGLIWSIAFGCISIWFMGTRPDSPKLPVGDSLLDIPNHISLAWFLVSAGFVALAIGAAVSLYRSRSLTPQARTA